MGAVLSPFLPTNMHQFKTLRYPDIKSTNDNPYYDTTFVLSEDHGNKLKHLKWLCPSDNNSIFITEQPSLLQRAITHTENEILLSFISYRFEITCGTRNSPAILILDLN